MTAAELAQLEAMFRRVAREELAAALQSACQRCSFCGADRADVRKLVVGTTSGALICDECVIEAMRSMIAGPSISQSAPVVKLPDELANQRFVRSRDVERHGGLVYVVATVPDLDIRRLKVGYTTRPIEQRIDAFRTANPTATLLGLWSVPSDGEDAAHRVVAGRLRSTEVFHVPDVVAALTAIDEELTRRWP